MKENVVIEKRGLSDFWIYVLGAFIVGLMLPDKANPYVMLMDLIQGKDKKDKEPEKNAGQTEGAGTTEPKKETGNSGASA